MTDITELAQSLKAAAIDAKELAIIARYSKGRAAAEKFYALANPNNVIALVEALEKAQQQTTESENRVRKQNRHICELFDDNTALRQRIAELESRTVTVKLPQRLQPGADGWDDWYVHSDDEGEYLKFDDVLAMLTAAGIKVEAE
ncbi:TPA: hypothetical protein ACF21I_003521 [Klebsiella quasipneumoniae subsp. similipneumoniae]|uniref:hypothetical protein n=1 Tax=Klebsiella quasipneumoniae TaxID=1463165 RepID=UPI0021580B6E|nr:hypothetical protein [Klebsiella quasipneumoniae]HDS6373337.1 hypothetical protein [Klebsiella quasipneumoniae subsp. similipneumoniae]